MTMADGQGTGMDVLVVVKRRLQIGVRRRRFGRRKRVQWGGRILDGADRTQTGRGQSPDYGRVQRRS